MTHANDFTSKNVGSLFHIKFHTGRNNTTSKDLFFEGRSSNGKIILSGKEYLRKDIASAEKIA
jgi:hypothetical protein